MSILFWSYRKRLGCSQVRAVCQPRHLTGFDNRDFILYHWVQTQQNLWVFTNTNLKKRAAEHLHSSGVHCSPRVTSAVLHFWNFLGVPASPAKLKPAHSKPRTSSVTFSSAAAEAFKHHEHLSSCRWRVTSGGDRHPVDEDLVVQILCWYVDSDTYCIWTHWRFWSQSKAETWQSASDCCV